MAELRGWLLDVYTHPRDEVVIWLIGEDGGRHRLRMQLPIRFYVSGPTEELRRLWRFVRGQPIATRLERQVRQDLYGDEHECLAIQVLNAAQQRGIFRRAQRAFPDLDYYNADIALPIHFHSAFGVYPLAHCHLRLSLQGQVESLEALSSAWAMESSLPPLRVLEIHPNSNPGRVFPSHLAVRWEQHEEQIDTNAPETLLVRLNHLIDSYDPDILACGFGDKWLFPYLFELASQHKLPFNPNRERGRPPIQVKENSFSSYGRIVHRDQQTLLLGRAHLDAKNSMSFKDFGLAGTCELAKVTGLPLQNAARRSPGGGFTAMQIREALQRGILLPLNKKRHERYKSAAELLVADNGGLIFQPLTGLHSYVAEIDFFSMYPSLMSAWNISPETVNARGQREELVPVLDRPISQDQPGLVATVLKPVIDKRREAKRCLKAGGLTDEELKHYTIVADTLKWLGWVSFGYQGFSGNRIGSIEAHEAINGISRELLLRAKEAAEDHGFTVLHMYVDSLFIYKPGAQHTEDFQAVVADMEARTKLQLDQAEFFHWVAFLTSKTDRKLPVPNCYFGAYWEQGELRIKCRGIMARRGDTPLYIANCQVAAIERMARCRDADELQAWLPKLIYLLKGQYQRLVAQQVPVNELVIAQNLGRELDSYRSLSAVGRAAKQLAAAGRLPRAGQRVAYLRVVGQPDVLAWELVRAETTVDLDYAWYQKAFRRAAHELVESFGVPEEALEDWLSQRESYFRPEDFAARQEGALPLFG